jgi:phosphorylcholine metabolism protein LicD
MPLQDFKKFIDICGKYADGTKYKLHYPGNEKDSNFTWGFISIAGTKIKFKNSISDEAKLGLDIFPFEKTVEAPAVYGLQRRILLNHRE